MNKDESKRKTSDRRAHNRRLENIPVKAERREEERRTGMDRRDKRV